MVKTILLVDADPLSIGRIRKVLGRAGLRVQLALDGRTGVAEFRRLRPDLTLVQDVLAVSDGLESCRRMKALPGGGDRPVAILTAPRNHAVLLETGCDAYIAKPFEDSELLEVVRELLFRADDPALCGAIDLPACAPEIARPAIPLELTEDDLERHLEQVLVLSAR